MRIPWAYAMAGVHAPAMMAELAGALEQRLGALEPPHLAQVASAYAAQSVGAPRLFRALMRGALVKYAPPGPPNGSPN